MASAKILGSASRAASDLGAAPLVRICLAGGSAVVVGRTALRTRHAIGPQRAIADVSPAGQNTPIDLRVHLHFFFVEAFSNQTLATGWWFQIQSPKVIHLRDGGSN